MPKRVNPKNNKDTPSKNVVIKKTNISENVNKRVELLRSIVQKTIVSASHYKSMDVLGTNELKSCLDSLHRIFVNLDVLSTSLEGKTNINSVLDDLQKVTNDISGIFKSYGTQSLEDLLMVCFSSDYFKELMNNQDEFQKDKMNILSKYCHPISYRIIPWKSDPNENPQIIKKNRIVDDFMIVENGVSNDCFDLARTSKNFYTKVYGIKIAFRNYELKKTMIICAIVDDIMLECAGSCFINNRILKLKENYEEKEKQSDLFIRYLKCLTVKDLLVYSDEELINRFIGHQNQVGLIKQKTISQVTKEFIGNEIYQQRTTLMQLLLYASEHEYQYLAYLLYDLLTNDVNGSIDTHEQTLIFDSLPWNVKRYFRDAMKQTINYTNNLSTFDNSKIPLEQQICLMKADESVKEKAMLKLKEVKAKSEDSGSKARQYLEALLRIPFGIYRNEPILNVMEQSTTTFNSLVSKINDTEFPIIDFPNKTQYTSIEMRKYADVLREKYVPNIKENFAKMICDVLTNNKRHMLISHICNINNYFKQNNISYSKILHSGKKVDYMKTNITNALMHFKDNTKMIMDIADTCNVKQAVSDVIPLVDSTLTDISMKSNNITKYMEEVGITLDKAVHGHKKAKRQVERIIGQWINGEKTGYCFGFEGPPGVGKTSLAKKGIANCLKDNEGTSRPFSFIAIGGSSNGSTLDGHNYTYVGSTWGRIVDILMETKCMNPIIFIDELDKVSRTEHGKEIIGILTHLIDQTQNDSFQDKYFNGIDLDLSKALFIFSYNDPALIDRILLDRIHRVKFDHLSLEDKLVITKKYLFDEIYSKMGLEGVIDISDEVIKYIIDQYTCEPGVRKLKEILFEIIGEINLSILQNEVDYPLPIVITKDDVKYKYLKNRHEVKPKEIHTKSRVGLISGLWANALGQGGVLPIEISYFPSATMLDLKLTGKQGDVMKESMTVAKTLAWNLACKNYPEKMEETIKNMEKFKNQGIHIHVPEGATPKDGPSAGTAITVALYSLFTDKKIKHTVAITGEMCLQGKVTAIGGLDLKILGGIKAGVKTFIFPKENDKDFKDFMEKYKDHPDVEGITFLQLETIQEVLEQVFEEE
uniref:Lon proteolytic domain-containing protein n=1 Tax=viral metagenome TaxID=1070528 RepID=A0A6C0CQN2_9ZZZZ